MRVFFVQMRVFGFVLLGILGRLTVVIVRGYILSLLCYNVSEIKPERVKLSLVDRVGLLHKIYSHLLRVFLL